MATAAELIANKIADIEGSDPVEPTEVEEVEVEDTETEDEVEEAEAPVVEDELPDNIKEILKKNRKEARDALRRAEAAERALEAKSLTEEEGAEVAAAAETKYRDLYVTTAAKSLLQSEGAKSGVDRLVRLLDLSSIEIDDEDGSVIGLDEQVEELKTDFPDLFGGKAPAKPRTPKADAAPRDSAPAKPKSSAEVVAARLQGK